LIAWFYRDFDLVVDNEPHAPDHNVPILLEQGALDDIQEVQALWIFATQFWQLPLAWDVTRDSVVKALKEQHAKNKTEHRE
jgi:hypothetical protein